MQFGLNTHYPQTFLVFSEVIIISDSITHCSSNKGRISVSFRTFVGISVSQLTNEFAQSWLDFNFYDSFVFIPPPLRSRRDPFVHSDYLYELKYDGFRALAYLGAC